MTTQELMDLLSEKMYEEDDVSSIRTFEDAGLLTYDDGIVIKFNDGSNFQVSIKQA